MNKDCLKNIYSYYVITVYYVSLKYKNLYKNYMGWGDEVVRVFEIKAPKRNYEPLLDAYYVID